jgi:hypothetical protein
MIQFDSDKGRCEGEPRSRDGAYHQGAVWAWRMDPFSTASMKAILLSHLPHGFTAFQAIPLPLSLEFYVPN